MHEKITIQCTPLTFYCQNDETALFDWLTKVTSIKSVKGVGKSLILTFDNNNISDEDLINVMGIFKRYAFENEQQLNIFMNNQNKHWFE